MTPAIPPDSYWLCGVELEPLVKYSRSGYIVKITIDNKLNFFILPSKFQSYCMNNFYLEQPRFNISPSKSMEPMLSESNGQCCGGRSAGGMFQ